MIKMDPQSYKIVVPQCCKIKCPILFTNYKHYFNYKELVNNIF